MKQDRVYTIGYTAFEPRTLVDVLNKYGVHCLVDVRSTPASARLPQYSKSALEALLKGAGLRYRHYPEFGARQEDPAYFTPEGYLDFERYIGSGAFLAGVEKLREGMDMGFCFALMCAEKDPINCHRAIMVARGFERAGIGVWHIRVDGEGVDFLESQRELERRLMRRFGDDPDQLSLFETLDERIDRACRRQNAAIGYRMEDDG